jgi:hypothetical protein
VLTLGIITPAGASAKVIESSGVENSAGHGVWLPLMLILVLALVTAPAIVPKSFWRARR